MGIIRKQKFIKYLLSAIVLGAMTFFVNTGCTNQSATAKPNFVFKDAPSKDAAAKIGNEVITEDELISADRISYYDLQKKQYELKINLLKEILVERLVGAEAKKANMDLETFIDKKVLKDQGKISEKEFKNFVKEKRIPEAQINDQLKARIEAFLKEQKKQVVIEAYVAKLTKSNPVEVYFKRPKMDLKIELGQAPTWGNPTAKVTLVEFSDFQCPFCSRATETVTKLKSKYGNKIQIVFKHFPLPMHRDAKPAAEASMCANDQSIALFWKMHDLLFKNSEKLKASDLEGYAKQAGVDIKKYKECIDSKKYAAQVEADMKYGEKLGVRSTPTFFINGNIIAGAASIEEFSEIIDEELSL